LLYFEFAEIASRNIDTEEFIVEVESRPVIWNSALKEYSNKQARRQTWEEIVEKFGAELSKEEKNEIGKKCLIYLLIYYSLLINLFVNIVKYDRTQIQAYLFCQGICPPPTK
jgi:hypothetical protein